MAGFPDDKNQFARQGDLNLTYEDNNCYFDTTLQALASLPSVPRAFEKLKTMYQSQTDSGPKAKACRKFIISIADKIIEISTQTKRKTDSHTCRSLLKGAIRNWNDEFAKDIKSDRGGSRQHDVGEFLIFYLFDTIIDRCGDGSSMTTVRREFEEVQALGQSDDDFRVDFNNAIKRQLDYFEKGILSNLFYFVLSKRHNGSIIEDRTPPDQGKARDPGPFDYRRLESYATLTMPFTEKKKGTTTVFELMNKNFTAVESMGEEQKISESITYETAFQSEKFGSLPQIFCMTLNRRTRQSNGTIVKVDSPVEIEWEKDLDFLPFVEEVCQEKYSGKSTYRLYAVTFHWGSSESGHYTCACRTKEGWKYFDNIEETRDVDNARDKKFMEQNSTAFFYEKLDDSGDYALRNLYEPAGAKPARSIPQAQAALKHPKSVEDILVQLNKPDEENILEQTIIEDLNAGRKSSHWIWYMYPQSKETAPGKTNYESQTEDEIQNQIFTNEKYRELFNRVNAQSDSWFPPIDMGRITSFRKRNRELIEMMRQDQGQKIKRGFSDEAGKPQQIPFTVSLAEQRKIMNDIRQKRKRESDERASAAEKRQFQSKFSRGRNTPFSTPSRPKPKLQPAQTFRSSQIPIVVADGQKPATQKISTPNNMAKLQNLLRAKEGERNLSAYMKSLKDFFAKNPITADQKKVARKMIEKDFERRKNFSRDFSIKKQFHVFLDKKL